MLTIFTYLFALLPHIALENFILFARRDEIFRISLDISELIDVRLPLVNLTGASGLDWDDRTDKIFWTDVLQDTISSSNSNVSSVYTSYLFCSVNLTLFILGLRYIRMYGVQYVCVDLRIIHMFYNWLSSRL